MSAQPDWKPFIRETLRLWADYINMLRVREIAKHAPAGGLYSEAVYHARHKTELARAYPYQAYLHLCDQCGKTYLKKPDRCGKCGRYKFTLIREGVTGRRVFASMIPATGYDRWEREVRIDEKVKKLPSNYYQIIKMRYCDDHMTQEEMAGAEGIPLSSFQKYLYEGECMLYGLMSACHAARDTQK